MKRIYFYITISLIGTSSNAFAGNMDSALEHCLIQSQSADCQTTRLNLYVGPQSVEPGEPIYIAIEAQNAAGGSGNAADAVIVDTFSGREYKAAFENGLAKLQLSAPIQAGRLTFIARHDSLISETAEVLVHAAKPQTFSLDLEKQKGQIFISSSLIADPYGNMIEDGQLVQITLSDGKRLTQSFNTLTQSGRINFRVKCSSIPKANILLHAKLRNASAKTTIPDYMCNGGS